MSDDTQAAETAATSQSAASAALDAGQWYEKFENAEVKTFAAGLKPEEAAAFALKYKDFKDVDPSRILTLPEKVETLEDLAPVLSHFAAQDAKAYELDKVEGLEPGVIEPIAAAMKEMRVPPVLGKALAAKVAEIIAANEAAYHAEAQKAAAAEIEAVTKELGAEKVEIARRAARSLKAALGKDAAEAIDALETVVGAGPLMKAFAFFGGHMREDSFVDGAGGKAPPADIGQRWYGDAIAQMEANRGRRP